MNDIFTARVAKRAKVMFSQAFVCPSPEGGEEVTMGLDHHHPPPTWDLVTTPHPPPGNWSPPPCPPPQPGTWSPPPAPPGTRSPPLPPPHLELAHHHHPPPPPGTWSPPPPPHPVKRRAVRILLECILVTFCMFRSRSNRGNFPLIIRQWMLRCFVAYQSRPLQEPGLTIAYVTPLISTGITINWPQINTINKFLKRRVTIQASLNWGRK